MFAALETLNGGALTAGHPARELLLRFGLMFVVGAAMQLYAPHVPLRTTLAGIAVVLLVTSLAWAPAYLLLAPPAVAYLLLSLGRRQRLSWVGARRDLSYGLYLYAWPVQLLLLLAGADSLGIGFFLVASLLTTLGLAWLSWTVVERPALGLKSWSPPVGPWRLRRV
jgi:peptidoglycan/LPS O-acetylase OafA/YrhL